LRRIGLAVVLALTAFALSGCETLIVATGQRMRLDGSDASPGRGGGAGHVTVTMDPAAVPWLDRLHITNKSGDGAPGPAATVVVAPVASPW